MAPYFTLPFSMGALNAECFGPQIGVSTQRVPLASSQLAIDPQMPADAKLTSSLQMSGRAVERRAMIVAADGLGVHQVHAALLAGVHHQFLALVVEDGGRHLHIEIALHQPLGVGRSVVVHQQQRLRLRDLASTPMMPLP